MDYCGAKKCETDEDCIDDPPIKMKNCISSRCKVNNK